MNSRMSTGDWLVSTVKKNPEGLLLLAAGCALLMRTGGSSSQRRASDRDERVRYPEVEPYHGGHVQRSRSSGADDARSGMTEGARTYANKAYEYASDVTDKVTEKTGTYAAAATEYADDLRRNTMERSEQLMQSAHSTMQNTMNRVLREQPLTVALVGLAAGAAVAAAFPTTDLEKKTLGPAGERISDAVTQAGEQVKQAASEAGEKLKSAAEERGLNKDGLKEVARDVAGTFGETFSGSGSQDQENQSSSRPAGTSSGSSGSPGPGGYPSGSSGPGTYSPGSSSASGRESTSSSSSRTTPFPGGAGRS